ncbi:MAG: SufE family protein [Prolixibacteraceae bacterium]|nr:SufE family protein [Prolixibacteraceae bacterium]
MSEYRKDNMMTIEEIQQEIIGEFAFFDDWMDKYSHLIEMGNNLPPMPDEKKTDQNMIRGCQSQVWIDAEYSDGTIVYHGDSDALIVKGLVALMLRVVNNQKPQAIMDTDFHFIDKIGLKEHLSPTRSNGLLAMIKQIKLYAVAFNKINSLNS